MFLLPMWSFARIYEILEEGIKYYKIKSLYLLISYIFVHVTLLIANLTKQIMTFNCGLIPTYYNCNWSYHLEDE
jgi:hypothetical protein